MDHPHFIVCSVMEYVIGLKRVKMTLFMFTYRTENLKKGAAPVNNDDIIDMIQTNMFAEIGCGK